MINHLLIDHNRLAPSELGDRGRYLGHGRLVLARVPSVRDHPIDVDLLDFHISPKAYPVRSGSP
jgi:hypothetical protein